MDKDDAHKLLEKQARNSRRHFYKSALENLIDQAKQEGFDLSIDRHLPKKVPPAMGRFLGVAVVTDTNRVYRGQP